jgi:hypothetical protein
MKDIVLITGANGHLAKVVSQYLRDYYNVRHLTTKKILSSQESYFYWDINKMYIDPKALENCKHIVHLAGFPILKRWTIKNKQIMYDSRVESTNLILDICKKNNYKPKTFISASAIGIYEKSLEDNVHENSPKGNDWLAKMASDWENAAYKFKGIGSRIVQMRISLIFSDQAGFLKYNLLSMKFGIGAIVGDENRLINWMHVKDIARFIKESISNDDFNGAYNVACDDKKSQGDFIRAIKKNLFPYSIIIKIPMILASFFLGKRSQIIDTNISLDTKKIKQNGFKCKINTLEQLLENLKINL